MRFSGLQKAVLLKNHWFYKVFWLQRAAKAGAEAGAEAARMGGIAQKERLGSGWISHALISRIRARTAATS